MITQLTHKKCYWKQTRSLFMVLFENYHQIFFFNSLKRPNIIHFIWNILVGKSKFDKSENNSSLCCLHWKIIKVCLILKFHHNFFLSFSDKYIRSAPYRHLISMNLNAIEAFVFISQDSICFFKQTFSKFSFFWIKLSTFLYDCLILEHKYIRFVFNGVHPVTNKFTSEVKLWKSTQKHYR